ncbi:teichuronic acid biosynthesis glycosyltransferase TuaC [Methylomarinovum caldicuralii]|uniref:Teichuronic acid biosynthesis glycosyltransferase TuaC n=1 Tax=Methylomarinovum caldicuralii TaxID=438856 RepID=A0AAU9C9C8_9GAMM|nr:glycosyltransferase [Methylomarinovum caldicuralii]BCX82146.1 teichuronic acid biosynthesis glycosyltransferase TuaC [Methylomarinovum caldicuralii]
MADPRILVLSSLFPSSARPQAGLFISERMFRVARQLPLTVVSPQPWFPLQGLVRRLRPHFRPLPPTQLERQDGIEVHYPRFFSVPGFFKGYDGHWMARGCQALLDRLKESQGFDLIDAHFAYPDGYAAVRLGRRYGVPVTITLRGTEVPLSRDPVRRERILAALAGADQVFSVSESLKRHVVSLGAEAGKITVVGNGVDTEVFHPVPQHEARQKLGIAADAKVLVTVGALVPRKGQQRVLEVLPALIQRFPKLLYLIVGGPSPEGDQTAALQRQVEQLGLAEHVRFLGPLPPERLKWPLSAADVFVLATANEGWANVFLEAMACGLPVVTTDVGGNREVVCREELGIVVPFGDIAALGEAIGTALDKPWDRKRILAYARENEWDGRVEILVNAFRRLTGIR